MSTRANIIIQDNTTKLYFYRHSDGYPSSCGKDLADFVTGYASGALRDNAGQSAGWLILRGHFEYNETPSKNPNPKDRMSGWKVGAYEPTDNLHGDVEYIYIIDLEKGSLSCREPAPLFWDEPKLENTNASKEFKTLHFLIKNGAA